MSRRAWCYEIRVAESLDDRWLQWFLDLGIAPVKGPVGQETGSPGTLLRGRLPDQTALFGLLTRVRDFNLTLLEVRRLEDE